MEPTVLNQDQINTQLVEMMLAQRDQRDQDYQYLVGMFQNFQDQMGDIENQIADIYNQAVQQGGINHNLHNRLVVLADRYYEVVRRENVHGNYVIDWGQQAAVLDERVRGILLELQRRQEVRARDEEERLQAIREIAINLGEESESQKDNSKILKNAALHLNLAGMAGIAGGGALLLFTASPALFLLGLKIHAVSLPFWGASGVHNHLAEKNKQILESFENFVREGISPDLALEMAKKGICR